MGFFDNVKKGAAIASKGIEVGLKAADKVAKKNAAKKSDLELLEMDSSNKYVRDELQKRGL